MTIKQEINDFIAGLASEGEEVPSGKTIAESLKIFFHVMNGLFEILEALDNFHPLEYAGAYEAGAEYDAGAVVNYDSNLYVCTAEIEEAGETPDAEHFAFFANATPPTVEG